jgi:hypothetical protein
MMEPDNAGPSPPRCKNCLHFLDYSDVEVVEPVGYCGHPFHFTNASEHREYGGHWTSSYSQCDMYEPKKETADDD